MDKVNETTLEINLHALAHNFNYLKSKTSQEVKIMAVVKAFAYGNEPVLMGEQLVKNGADYLAVTYVKEGVALREAGITKPILVFHPQSPNFKELIACDLMPTLYSKRTLGKFIKAVKQENQEHYPVHLCLNTGMNRLGFGGADIDFIKQQLKTTNSIKVEGIYSHLAASEDLDEQDFTYRQFKKYKNYSNQIIDTLGYEPMKHLCNTSGILNYKSMHLDMVRAGIGLYGYGNSAEVDKNLKPVGRLKTLISQIQYIKKGDTVGYNRRYIAEKDRAIAILPLGYADGLHRQYGNGKTSVLINNALAPVIGDLCMGMTMVDVSKIECREGAEVLIFGEEKSAEAMARNAGTISYELITAISERVQRKVVEK